MSFEYPHKIRFKCVKCGICCGDTKEKTRHILLLDKEANNIATTTNQPVTVFALKIADKTPYCYEMRKTEKGKCVFLRENRCSVYMKRPLICRYYPFGLETNQNQQKNFYYANECPGIGKGKIIKEEDFRKLLRLANKRSSSKHETENREMES